MGNELNNKENVFEITGRIESIRNLGKIFFIDLFDQDNNLKIFLEKEVCNGIYPKVGDFIRTVGIYKFVNGTREFHPIRIRIVGTNNNDRKSLISIPSDKMQRLLVRSKIDLEIHRFMNENSYLPVNSPTIVGNWIEGKTSTFAVDYFGTTQYLTLNNMLYHQILLITGYTRIYEIAKVFRQNAKRPNKSLTEFFTLDISTAHTNAMQTMDYVETMVRHLSKDLKQSKYCQVDDFTFDRITYSELCQFCSSEENIGAQLSSEEKQFLNRNFKGFVWVTGFPENKRRFFVKSVDGTCLDYQLWYRGEGQVAAGSERETDLRSLERRILEEGKHILNYSEILAYFRGSVPEMSEIGFGIDRFLHFSLGGTISDYVPFPRTGRKFSP